MNFISNLIHMNIKNGNCLELMKKIEDKSVDLFICDLPYGETNCKWDILIDMEEFWKQFKRIRKHDRVACIHFCSTKFGHTLIKSWEKGFKMDMVWKKRNKTGGLQSRNRPMRNHEMVYFFYDKCPKYNRDKYHKRIQPKKEHNIEKETVYGKSSKMGTMNNFLPPNPASVVEEKDIYGETKKQRKIRLSKSDSIFKPPNPASVINEVEEADAKDKKDLVQVKDENYKKYNSKVNGHTFGKKAHGAVFKPPNPASVVEEKTVYGMVKKQVDASRETYGNLFKPPNPSSVINEVEDEPVSMFESSKVFIGKRHHQTEKPLDILEFFLKYWTDEGDTVLDPTMGSGSTGVACKNLKRNFIGFELDPKIFEVAKKRINK